jgi:hypothetical protein
MRNECAVLTATPRHDDVVRPVAGPEAIAQIGEFRFPPIPIHNMVFFKCPLTRRADALRVEFCPRSLVGYDAVLTEVDFLRKLLELSVER